MSPPLSADNIRNICRSYAEHFSKLSLIKFSCIMQTSNFYNLILGKLCGTFSSLACSVICVIFGGTKKKMIRVNTSRIVTFMTNMKPIQYLTKIHFPRHTMSIKSLFIYPNLSISSGCFPSSPFPAGMKWDYLNLRPKSINGAL